MLIHSQGPSGRLKTSVFALGFQHFLRDLANVNDWKIMFDPSIIIINKVPLYALKTLGITLSFQTEGHTPGFQIFFGLRKVWFGV